MLRLIALASLGLFLASAVVNADDRGRNRGKNGGNNPAQTAAAKFEGRITAVGAASVTIARGTVSKTFIVNAATKVERNDRHVALSAFKVGDRGEAVFNATTLVASKVEATGP